MVLSPYLIVTLLRRTISVEEAGLSAARRAEGPFSKVGESALQCASPVLMACPGPQASPERQSCLGPQACPEPQVFTVLQLSVELQSCSFPQVSVPRSASQSASLFFGRTTSSFTSTTCVMKGGISSSLESTSIRLVFPPWTIALSCSPRTSREAASSPTKGLSRISRQGSVPRTLERLCLRSSPLDSRILSSSTSQEFHLCWR